MKEMRLGHEKSKEPNIKTLYKKYLEQDEKEFVKEFPKLKERTLEHLKTMKQTGISLEDAQRFVEALNLLDKGSGRDGESQMRPHPRTDSSGSTVYEWR